MPPKRIQVQPSTSSSRRPTSQSAGGYLSAAYREITAPENQSVVVSVAMFGVAVAFFHSSLSELLIPA